MLFGAPDIVVTGSLLAVANAQTLQEPPGFADIVDKVKPAVISVRVKFGASPRTTDDSGSPSQPESPLERFFRYLHERRFGSFERSFQLPEGVDADKIEASFKKGLLTVTLPKTAEAQKAEKKITVKAA
jgi:HSP20 family protein